MVCCTLSGCTGGTRRGTESAQAAASEHVVERSVHNGVEIIRNISGSRWSGRPHLVEELSIGEEAGEEPYLFGRITDAWATDDRIYLIDAQIPVVRAFDDSGLHLFDIGGSGQGPGYGLPQGLAVTAEGTIAIADVMAARINIYDEDGDLVEDRPAGAGKSGLGLTLGYDGKMYTLTWSNERGRFGMRELGPEGPGGEVVFPPAIDFEPAAVSVGEGMEMVLPFAATSVWTFTPGAEMLVGTGDRYRLEVHAADGRRAVIERSWDPIATTAAEAEFHAAIATSAARQMVPGGWIAAAQIPAHKPAFTGFFPDRAGRAWVIRQGPGVPDPSCTAADQSPTLLMSTPAGTPFASAGKPGAWSPDGLDASCWTDTVLFDLFDLATGDLLGTVEAPEPGFREPLFADEDTVLAAVADRHGTVRLKRYRLRVD